MISPLWRKCWHYCLRSARKTDHMAAVFYLWAACDLNKERHFNVLYSCSCHISLLVPWQPVYVPFVPETKQRSRHNWIHAICGSQQSHKQERFDSLPHRYLPEDTSSDRWWERHTPSGVSPDTPFNSWHDAELRSPELSSQRLHRGNLADMSRRSAQKGSYNMWSYPVFCCTLRPTLSDTKLLFPWCSGLVDTEQLKSFTIYTE